MAIKALNLVVIRVTDLDTAERFYSALGLTLNRHRHGSGPEHCAAVLGSQVFEVYPLGSKDSPTLSTRIGFAVSELDRILASVIPAGGRIIVEAKESEWGRRAVIADPFEHKIELIEEAGSHA